MHVEDNKSQGPCLVSFLCRPVSPPPQSWRHQPVTHHTKPEVTKFQTLGHIGTPPKLRSTKTKAYCPALHPHPGEWSVWLLWLMSVVALPSRLPSQSPAFTSPCQCVPACTHQELCARSYCQCAYICVYRKWIGDHSDPRASIQFSNTLYLKLCSTSFMHLLLRLITSKPPVMPPLFPSYGVAHICANRRVTHWQTVATFVTHWHWYIDDFWTLDELVDFN